ncbi:hypothetical protein THIARS_60634 [Thiomonas delicata]|uniref:Uncharacterized protein n=1 Tax=Thiomonas delicata TaxID=364030 RepID=A0A238D3X6_THIDL|nr:hypothetical protein THIARS_60634 [Thiomonas delicata]
MLNMDDRINLFVFQADHALAYASALECRDF